MLDIRLLMDFPSERILKNFWVLCDWYKAHVNDGKCALVYPAIRRYTVEYERRTGCPILVMNDCASLISELKRDGLQ